MKVSYEGWVGRKHELTEIFILLMGETRYLQTLVEPRGKKIKSHEFM